VRSDLYSTPSQLTFLSSFFLVARILASFFHGYIPVEGSGPRRKFPEKLAVAAVKPPAKKDMWFAGNVTFKRFNT